MSHPVVAAVPAGTFEEELLHLLARQGRRVPIPVFLVAVVIAAMAAERVPIALPVAWLGLVVLVLYVRWIVLGRLPSLTSISVSTRLKLAVALSAINGITHALSLGFFWYLPDFERAIQSMLLIGLCAGSVGTTAGYMPVFLAYLIPTLGPLAILWAIRGTASDSLWVESAAAVLIVFLGLVLFALGRDAFRLFKESFDIRLQQAELNAKLRNALEEAEAASRAKTRFLVSASHDLRQPMHSLSLFAAALALRQLDDRSRGLVMHMNEALLDLSSELDSLLDVSKLDAGLVQAHRKAVAIKPLIDRVHQTFLADARAKNLEFEVDCPDDLFVNTDRDLLERAVRNLVENAIKYTKSGSVRLGATADAESVELTIADTGPGIPEREHAHVFEEFYQLDNPERDRTKGLGLGLSIVKRHLELLEIRLDLISSPGSGTKFVLTLDRVYPSESGAATRAAPAGFSLNGLHVLVVDDEAKVRLSTKEWLENLGCRVSDVDGTAQAALSARANRPDIVLVDLRLRGDDHGIAAVRAIREIYPQMPALIISGDTAPERLREADAAGMTLLHKPVAVDALKKAIATASGRMTADVA